MKYQKKAILQATIDQDQYRYLGKLADERRSSISQVLRELLDKVIKEEDNVSRNR